MLSVLTPSDLNLIHQFEISAALSGRITESGVAKLATHPDVVHVALDRKVFGSLNQSRSLIRANIVQFFGYDGTGVAVAVLDSGIDTNHPDLLDNIIGEACFLPPAECGPPAHPAEDDHGHGTHVSGIITSNGGIAPRGVAPNAGIFAYKVLDANLDGSSSAVLQALEHIEAAGFQVDFVNMSLGSDVSYAPGNCPLLGAIENKIFDLFFFGGVVSFAPSGNEEDKSGMNWPACISLVVSVGSVYDSAFGPDPFCPGVTPVADIVPCTSNSSDDLELLAPGCDILSTWPTGFTVNFLCGTSQAVPHVVGVAALLKQARPSLSAFEIRNRLEATGTLVIDELANRTTPRVDARVALLTDDAADFDRDGCSNGQEFGLNELLGGQRNPLYFWDFFDAETEFSRHSIGFLDYLAVLQRFNTTDNNKQAAINRNSDPVTTPDPGPGNYHPWYDRGVGPIPGANLWDEMPADGAIGQQEQLAVLRQFNTVCFPPP